MQEDSKKSDWKIIIPLFVLVILGAFLRIYRQADFLHFELDQARDAIIISEAIKEGPGELPLLGPRAAGTMLRLGPFFYYLSYGSALIFGNLPAGINYGGIFISLLTIPLAYLFLRIYFTSKIALLTTSVLTVSLFLVTYGRFSWNPNTLPFFTLLLFYCLLNFFEHKKEKLKPLFLYGGAFSLGVIIQLHFLSFVVAPLVVSLFILFKILNSKLLKKKEGIEKQRTKLGFLNWFLACLIILLLNSPVLINEYLTGGDNSREFFSAITEKKAKDAPHNLGESIFRNFQEYSRGYFLIISGNQKAEISGLEILPPGALFDLKCDKECRKNFGYSFLGWLFFLGGIIFILRDFLFLFRGKTEIKERTIKLDFLFLVSILLLVTFGGFLSVAFSFPPRFLLITIPVVFVFLGLFLQRIENWGNFLLERFRPEKKGKKLNLSVQIFVFTLTLVLFSANIFYNYERFKEQAAAHTKTPLYFPRDLVLKEDIRFTLLQQDLILDWIMKNSSHATVFVWAPPKYYRPFIYQLDYLRGKDGRRLRYSIPCEAADYFAVTRKADGADFLLKGAVLFEVENKENLGTLNVLKLKPKNTAEIKEKWCEEEEEEKPASYARRYTWGEIFEKDSK